MTRALAVAGVAAAIIVIAVVVRRGDDSNATPPPSPTERTATLPRMPPTRPAPATDEDRPTVRVEGPLPTHTPSVQPMTDDNTARFEVVRAKLREAAKTCVKAPSEARIRVRYTVQLAGGTARTTQAKLVSGTFDAALDTCIVDAMTAATWPMPGDDTVRIADDIPLAEI